MEQGNEEANLLLALLGQVLGAAALHRNEHNDHNHDNHNHDEENQTPHLEAAPEAAGLVQLTREAAHHGHLLSLELDGHVGGLADRGLPAGEQIESQKGAGNVLDVVGLALLHLGGASKIELLDGVHVVALHRHRLQQSVVLSVHYESLQDTAPTPVGGISLLGGGILVSEDEHGVALASALGVHVLLDLHTAHITVQAAANIGSAFATVLGQERRTAVVGVSTAGYTISNKPQNAHPQSATARIVAKTKNLFILDSVFLR